jgi:hypothetical protein
MAGAWKKVHDRKIEAWTQAKEKFGEPPPEKSK